MGAHQPSPDRPSTLGQAWRRMAEPGLRPHNQPRDLPTLPDWPPLPDEASPSAWSSSGSAGTDGPAGPDESYTATASSQHGRGGIHRRFRRPSKRARIGIIAAVTVVLVVLLVAGARFALRVPGGLGTSRALATATSHPTTQPKPTSTLPPAPLTLAFTCASGQIRGTGRVCVHTLPGSSLSLAVRYCDGSSAKGLHGRVTADGSGNYTWTWQVRTACAGPATATATATANSQSLTESDAFTITK